MPGSFYMPEFVKSKHISVFISKAFVSLQKIKSSTYSFDEQEYDHTIFIFTLQHC